MMEDDVAGRLDEDRLLLLFPRAGLFSRGTRRVPVRVDDDPFGGLVVGRHLGNLGATHLALPVDAGVIQEVDVVSFEQLDVMAALLPQLLQLPPETPDLLRYAEKETVSDAHRYNTQNTKVEE